MNKYEIIFLLLTEMLLLLYLRWQFKSWRNALPLAIVSVAPLYLSLERTSQFLTADAMNIIKEPLYLASSDLGQWLLGALRTTDTSLGLLMVILRQYMPGMSETQGKIMLKSFHWLSGFTLLLWIHYLLSTNFVSRVNKKLFFVIFIFTAFLLPTNNLSLKIFTYDLLSMLLGILALLHILVAIKERNPRYAIIGIVIAFLAAQEKLSASPILVFALAVYGYLVSIPASKFSIVRLFWGVLLGFIIAAGTGIGCMLIVAGIRQWAVPTGFWASITDPFTSWAWVLMLFMFGIRGIDNLRAYTFLLLGLSFLASGLFAVGLLLISRFFTGRRKLLVQAIFHLNRANIVLAVLILLASVVGTYYVDAYWAPYFPITPGNYQSTTTMNGATWHFGATSLWQHIVLFVGYAYTVFVNATPSVYWLCLVSILASTRIFYQEPKPDPGLELLLTAALLMPLAFGLFQVPVGNKFLNIGLFLLAMVISFKITEFFTGFSPAKKIAFGVVFAVLLIGEILPFRPLYAPFRPIWSEYEDSTMPIVGKLNPSWLGWGEEAMLAGQLIEAQCHGSDNNTLNGIPCNLIRLYVRYQGEWLNEDTEITVLLHKSLLAQEEFLYPETDYYVLNRLAIAQAVEKFPVEVEPTFVISFRGYITAWVFRFDQLKAAGYQLVPVVGSLRLAQWQTLHDGAQVMALNSLDSLAVPPISCEIEPIGEFYDLWTRTKHLLGCPLYAEPAVPEAIEMPFEKGVMLSLGNLDPNARLIIPIFGRPESGTNGVFGWVWQYDQAGDKPGQTERSCAFGPPPAGRFLPNSGIDQVWRQPEIFEKIGWATRPEYRPAQGVVLMQDFEKAVLLRDSNGYASGWVYFLPRSTREYIRLPYR